jgi:DNA anti-recombination protein RmuC
MKEVTTLDVLELARKDAAEVGEDGYASKIESLINKIKASKERDRQQFEAMKKQLDKMGQELKELDKAIKKSIKRSLKDA